MPLFWDRKRVSLVCKTPYNCLAYPPYRICGRFQKQETHCVYIRVRFFGMHRLYVSGVLFLPRLRYVRPALLPCHVSAGAPLYWRQSGSHTRRCRCQRRRIYDGIPRPVWKTHYDEYAGMAPCDLLHDTSGRISVCGGGPDGSETEEKEKRKTPRIGRTAQRSRRGINNAMTAAASS